MDRAAYLARLRAQEAKLAREHSSSKRIPGAIMEFWAVAAVWIATSPKKGRERFVQSAAQVYGATSRQRAVPAAGQQALTVPAREPDRPDEGKVVLAESIGRNGVMSRSYVSPLAFVKLLHAYMLKSREQTIKRREAKIKQERTGGGIRVVLLRATADPLVKPGSHDGGNVEVVGRSLAPATAKR